METSRTFEAPGRVNLIGEHTDYTGGYVLPMAIPFATRATITPATGTRGEIRAYSFSSANFASARTVTAEEAVAPQQDWSDYPVGVLRELLRLGLVLPSFHLHVAGDVPLGAGLSSSASIEVAACIGMLSLTEAELSASEIAQVCRRAENDFVGSPCGIMDQFVSVAARAGHALLLNTRDLTFEHLPLNTGALRECVVVVANSMTQHSISSGDYGLRRRELEAGQKILRTSFPSLRDLGNATLEQLHACEPSMSAESFRRCRHVISENERVLEARDAMRHGDATALGRLMTRGHASERDDFECSTPEIDFLVETAVTLDGCYGARLTGGGFGGCTVNLVERGHAEAFGTALTRAYHGAFGVHAETYVCSASDGAMARAASRTGVPA